MHVRINLDWVDPPTAVLATIARPIIAPGEQSQIDAEITLWWKNVAPLAEGKYLSINLPIFCWDTREIRRETQYSLFLTESGQYVAGGEPVAPGVTQVSRRVTSRPVWFLNRVQPHWEQVQDFYVQKILPQIAKAQKLAREWWAKHKRK